MVEAHTKVTFENARLLFLNFSGREGTYNAAGQRNFCVELDDKIAKSMLEDGWNVKFPKVDDPEMQDARSPYLPVEVKFKVRPPKIVMISSGSRTILNESMVEILDGMDFENVDLIINASIWNVGDKIGVKAYLSKMFVTIEEDDLERKYAVMDEG